MSGAVKVLPLGGLGEIGMNCMVIEDDQDLFLVDCGLLFSELDHFGVDFIIPDFSYVVARKDKFRGFVLTHGHEDHIGSLSFAIKAGLQSPIWASPFTALMVRERLTESGFLDRTELKVFHPGDTIQVGSFKIKTVSVNHSIVDAAALIIETDMGKIIHTGDFRIDPTPFFGSELDLSVFKEAGDQGVLLLLSDSTNVEKCEHQPSENIIQKKFEQLMNDQKGLLIISLFSSNVGRMGQIFDLARKMGKKIALCGRSVEQNVRLAFESQYFKGSESLLIPTDSIENYDRKNTIVISSGCQGEFGAALNRIAYGDHKSIKLKPEDLVVLSSKFIPGNEKPISRMVNQLFKSGAQVLYESVQEIHVSGHATRPELKKMIEAVRPKFFIPVHGEYRHLVFHAALAKECGMKDTQVRLSTNGDLLEFTKDKMRFVEHFQEERIFVEGRDGGDISKLILKDRRLMGETGIVFALLVRDQENRKVLSEPEIISKGLVHESLEGFLIEEAKVRVKEVIRQYESSLQDGDYSFDLQEQVRVELRRFFKTNIGKKPVVLPIVMEL
ncbi:MAG: ribonuclease J [Xanthomonadaceae bacterium]|nr:ribonuclease J [Xanthomonadaceae bacterium]